MTPAVLAAALLKAMLALAPPAKLAALPAFDGWAETAEQRTARYSDIATAAATAADGNSANASLPIGIAFHESGFARDVDLGPCYRGKDGKSQRCDAGRAACLMQVRVDVHRKWTAAELFSDRVKCFRAGLEIARRSVKACQALGPEHSFDVYAGGYCVDGHSPNQEAHRRGLELLGLVTRVRGLVAGQTAAQAKGQP